MKGKVNPKMRGKIIFLLTMLIILSGFSSASAAGDNAEDAITLEQAVELAYKHSRNLSKYELNKRKAKYQLSGIEDQYEEANQEYDNLFDQLNGLSQGYSSLQETLDESIENGEDTSTVISAMNQITEETSAIWDKIDKQSEAKESISDNKRDAEDNLDDSSTAPRKLSAALGVYCGRTLHHNFAPGGIPADFK
ncbi:MAG: hypothetical protein IBX47_12885 [Desulfuromonadales bacterium]|nr:hypothetical protein [Desulfuromonadales bacterium]